MASDLFVFDNSFFSDPFSPFSDSSVDPQHDFFQTFEDSLNNHDNNDTNSNSIRENSVDETTYSLNQIASALFSSSPPSHQLEHLSICQTAQNFPNANDSDYSRLEVIKTEEYQVPLETIGAFNNPFVPQNNTADNVVKLMQRSYSSNSFDGKPNFFFHPRFDSLMEPPNMQSQVMNPPHENNLSSGQMRRVCSTGDLQVHNTPSKNTLSSSPLSTEGSFLEEANFKVGRYSAEERKERIHRYRAKRNQRNFNKTIKYACRKTLADNRPRIRGRFARNDEAVEIPKASMFTTRYEDEDDLWIEGFHEEDDEGPAVGRSTGTFYNNLGSAAAQYQYYSY